MQKLTVTLLLFLFFQIGHAQNKNVDAMKSKAKELIKEISKKESFTLTLFKTHMVPLTLLRKAAETPELHMSEENRAIIKNLKRDRYAELLKEDHTAIISEAKKHNINWKKIKFVELLYKPRALFKLGQPGFEGLLIFEDKTQKDILFTMQVDFIMLGTDPYILEMDDLKKEMK